MAQSAAHNLSPTPATMSAESKNHIVKDQLSARAAELAPAKPFDIVRLPGFVAGRLLKRPGAGRQLDCSTSSSEWQHQWTNRWAQVAEGENLEINSL